ncbi:MAG: YncE family protein [Pseudohongiellaceae bacterium]
MFIFKKSTAMLVLLGLSASTSVAQTYHSYNVTENLEERPVRIIQTNSAGTNVQVFDPRSMQQVGEIDYLPSPHGATVHPDGTYYYITNEHDHSVDVVDTRTLEVVEQIQLANRPHNISASHSARKVYVAIIAEPKVQIIDMDSNSIIKTIETAGGVHNTFVTPDGRYAMGGMIGASSIVAINTDTDEVEWTFEIDYQQSPLIGGIRPFAFTTNDDGSTRSILINVGGWHGFWEVDWDTREVLRKVSPPEDAWLPTDKSADGIQSAPSHGIVVLPDESQVWVSSRATSHVYAWSLPDYEYIGRVYIGNPAWLTATPDSKQVWIGVASHNETAVVDVSRMEVVHRFPVGQSPKRIFTAVFPENWPGEAL